MELTTVKPTSDSLNLAPLPVSFPVPVTDINLDCLPQSALFHQPLKTDIIRVFAIARSDIEVYIRFQEDSPILRHEHVLG